MNAAGNAIEYFTPSGGVGGSSAIVSTNRQTLSGGLTLTSSSANYQHLDPNGANRDITLPSPTGSDPNYFVIKNIASAGTAYGLVVKNSGGTTLTTIPAAFYMNFVYDGTTWEIY